jgi:hypothetical protein
MIIMIIIIVFLYDHHDANNIQTSDHLHYTHRVAQY